MAKGNNLQRIFTKMTIIRLSVHVLLLSTLLSCGFGQVQAQNADANEPVTGSLHVIGQGTINESNYDIPGYFVNANL